METKMLSREEIVKRIADLEVKLDPSKEKKRYVKEYNLDTHEWGQRELTYIPIYTTIEELNKRLGSQWSIQNTTASVTEIKYKYYDGKGRDRITKEGIETGMHMTLDLVICDDKGQEVTRRSGSGGATNKGKSLDIDTMIKTAQANAIRKAANNLGFGLYLWHAEDFENQDPIADDVYSEEIPGTSSPDTVVPETSKLELSEANKEKLKKLRETHGLGKEDLSAFLTKCYPSSSGKPDFLKMADDNGTQDIKIDKFIAYVSEEVIKAAIEIAKEKEL